MQQIEIPKSINEWTYELICQLVDYDIFETDTFDFKEVLARRIDDDYNLSIRKTVCAFANTKGGFIIFGVADRNSGKIGRDRLVGTERAADLAKLFGDKIGGLVEPNVYYIPQNPPILFRNDSTKCFFIVHVPSSLQSPHAVTTKDATNFYKRTNRGNEIMSYAAIEAAFSHKSIIKSKLIMLHIQLGNLQNYLNNLYVEDRGKQIRYALAVYDPSPLQLVVSELLYPLLTEDRELLLHLNRVIQLCTVIKGIHDDFRLDKHFDSKKAIEQYNSSFKARMPMLINELNIIIRTLQEKYNITSNPIIELLNEKPELSEI